MGRLPTDFAGRRISFRVPFSMPGELDVGPAASGVVFPEATFLHNTDKPFEIHRTLIRLTAKDANGVILEPQPTTLAKRIRLRITDFSKNENLTKSAALIDSILTNNAGTWEWAEPYVLVRSEGFQIQVDSQAYPSICTFDANCEPVSTIVSFVRVELLFQGFLIVVAPPSESR